MSDNVTDNDATDSGVTDSPVAEMSPTERLRSELCAAVKIHQSHADKLHASFDAGTSSMEERMATVGCTMAANYGYTLAAVLQVAKAQYGDEVADRLAMVADDIMVNGDFNNLNDDVMP